MIRRVGQVATHKPAPVPDSDFKQRRNACRPLDAPTASGRLGSWLRSIRPSSSFLAQLAGAELSFRREADLFGVSVLVLPGGRQVLVIERIYRDGTGVLLDPTPEEVEVAREGDLQRIWNSERRSLLSSEVWNWDGFGQ